MAGRRDVRGACARRLGRWALGAGLALAACASAAWGPTGQPVQAIAIVTSSDVLRALGQVHPPAAEMLAEFLPGRAAAATGIMFAEARSLALPTAATAELAVRGAKDRAAFAESMKPLPPDVESLVTRRHATWTGAGDLDVTFVSTFRGKSGADAGPAFPPVTVHISSGNPAVVAGWHLADAQETAAPPDQGPPAPVPGQAPARVPTTLEPLSAIKAYSQAMVRQDLDTMIALMHPVLVGRLGGPDQALAWMQRNLVQGRRLHAWPIGEQINDVRPLPAPGLDLYIVQSTRWFEDWPKPTGMSYVYLLDSPDKGRHWEVLDLGSTGLRWLHGIAPGFKDDKLVTDLLPDDLGAPG